MIIPGTTKIVNTCHTLHPSLCNKYFKVLVAVTRHIYIYIYTHTHIYIYIYIYITIITDRMDK